MSLIALGPGTGATPQIADAQGGRGGVGIRNSLPWVAAEPPLMQAPVKVSLLRYGLVKPSDNVCRKVTIWSSSLSVKPRLPVVMSMLFWHLGHRPAVYFFGRSCRTMSGSNRVRILVACVVEVYDLLQALKVAVVKELLLEVGTGGFGGRALRRCQGHVAQ